MGEVFWGTGVWQGWSSWTKKDRAIKVPEGLNGMKGSIHFQVCPLQLELNLCYLVLNSLSYLQNTSEEAMPQNGALVNQRTQYVFGIHPDMKFSKNNIFPKDQSGPEGKKEVRFATSSSHPFASSTAMFCMTKLGPQGNLKAS